MTAKEVAAYFHPLPTPEVGAPEAEVNALPLEAGQAAIQAWVEGLHSLVNELEQTGIVDATSLAPIKTAIEAWGNEKPEAIDHGAWHSYLVYRGIKWLSETEGQAIDDAVAQAMAVLHDLIQSLPWIDPQTGQPLPGNQRKLHAVAMAQLIHQVGRILELDSQQRTELSLAIRIHDAVYAGKTYSNLPFAAQALSDADKLFGATLPQGSAQDFIDKQLPGSIRQAVQRNAKGGMSYKGTGWYNLNDDLTLEQRDQWEYGDRFNLDTNGALRREYFGLPFYTETAQQIGAERSKQALEIIKDHSAERYQQTAAWVDAYDQAREAGTAEPLQWVAIGFGSSNQLSEEVPAEMSLAMAVQTAYQRVLEVPAAMQKKGFVARGWKLAWAGRSELLDPSIARFVLDPTLGGQAGFLDRVEHALVAQR